MSNQQHHCEQRVRVLFCDQLNLARGKYLPESFAKKGEARLCRGVYTVTYSRQLVPAPGGGLETGLPDIELQFDPEAYRPGWDDGSPVALADVYEGGKPSALCGRSALKRAIAAWQKHGLNPMIGLESEAYVLKMTDDGPKPYTLPGSFVYGTGPFNDSEDLMGQIWQMAEHCGIEIESLNSEFDAAQFELTLCYADALKACDDYFLFRNMARELLYQQGYLLTFLPKPLPESGGSGLHINISFTDEQGNNALANGTKINELSPLASGVIAGLIQHHTALGGILAPTVNSYERLQAGSMAGYWANWSYDHRAVAVRVSGESGSAARIEHRVADCAASPYFAVAGVLQAALLGYEQQYSLGEPETKDGFEQVSVEQHIAPDLASSLTALEQDTELVQAIGSGLIDNYCAIKRAEIDELNGLDPDQVTQYYLHFI